MPSGSHFTNNARTTLASDILSSTTTILVDAGTTNLFPIAENGSLDSGMWFYATLFSSDTVYEIVKVTYRQTDNPTWSIQRGREGTTARSWAAGTSIELRITQAGLKDYRENQPNIQHFTTVGTSYWTKPAGAKLVFFQAWGAGGGGASGARRSIASQASSNAVGGAGGSGGGYREAWINAAALASSLAIPISAGGLGGASSTLEGVSGNSGQLPAAGSISGVFQIPNASGTPAPGGFTTAPTQRPSATSDVLIYGDPQTGAVLNGRGGAGNVSGATSSPNGGSFGGGGGGGGGGYAANSTTGQGGVWGASGGLVASGIATGGSNGFGTAGNPGDRTSVPANLDSATYIGGGGGGGGSCVTFTSGQASDPGGNGGNGGWPGGGGGGGAAAQGANSGAGGNGGSGYVRITTFF